MHAEFDPLLREAGSNAFTMRPSKWVELTGTFRKEDILHFSA